MVVEKKYQVAISKNAKDEIVECFDCQIVGSEKYKAYKKEAKISQSKKEQELEKQLEEAKKEKETLASELCRLKLLVAKSFFDNEVASGKCETNEDFENDFDNFVYHNIALELTNAPAEFKAILERLG